MRNRLAVVRSSILGLTLLSAACGDDGGTQEEQPSECGGGAICPADGQVDGEKLPDAAVHMASPEDAAADASATDEDSAVSELDASEDSSLDASEDAASPDADASQPDAPVDSPDATVDAEVQKPPKNGFSLQHVGGVVPIVVTATSTATAGSAPITETLYDWFDGRGFVNEASHKYRLGGTFPIRQRVVDANGNVATSPAINVTLAGFTPVRFSATDKHAQVELSSDRYEARIVADTANAHAVRTDNVVTPGSGVFYFEAESLVPSSDIDFSSIGVGTSAHPLDQFVGLDEVTTTTISPSFGVNVGAGHIQPTGGTCTGRVVSPSDQRVLFDRSRRRFAFVIDYRTTSNPIIYALIPKEDDSLELRRSCSLVTSQPLAIIFAGRRSTLGPQVRINTGADVTNQPFHWSAQQVTAGLSTVEEGGQAAPAGLAALVRRGFGATRVPLVDQPPVLTTSADLTVAVGTPVSLSATATDVEDGSLTGSIFWSDLSAQFHLRQNVQGGAYQLTPTRIGRYPIEARVTDLDEITTRKVVMVNVTGALPVQPVSAVRLVETPGVAPGSSGYIDVSDDGLTVTRAGTTKNGARANQANYGNFWYFEARRNGDPADLGVGLVIPDGQINPYSFSAPPWSMSLNMATGIWRNLNPVAGYDTPATNNVFGFAVDYRGLHPKVFVIVGNAANPAAAQLEYQTELTEIWGPIHPMLYGTGAGPSTATINFGATPFVFSQARIESLLGAAAAGMAQRWGNP